MLKIADEQECRDNLNIQECATLQSLRKLSAALCSSDTLSLKLDRRCSCLDKDVACDERTDKDVARWQLVATADPSAEPTSPSRTPTVFPTEMPTMRPTVNLSRYDFAISIVITLASNVNASNATPLEAQLADGGRRRWMRCASSRAMR